MSQYHLKLSHFEGPLDLLLYLVKLNEINIFDIDMVLLTNQYLGYLRQLCFADLTDAALFLDMAAQLIEIKSKLLLPRETQGGAEGAEEEDPRKALQDQLLELELTRASAGHLAQLACYDLKPRSSYEYERMEELYGHLEAPLRGDAVMLVTLWEQLLRAFVQKKPRVQAKMHFVTVDEKIVELGRLLEEVGFTIFQSFYPRLQSRYELVVYLMAVLELAKMGRVRVYQDEDMGPIWVAVATIEESAIPRARSSDLLAPVGEPGQNSGSLDL